VEKESRLFWLRFENEARIRIEDGCRPMGVRPLHTGKGGAREPDARPDQDVPMAPQPKPVAGPLSRGG